MAVSQGRHQHHQGTPLRRRKKKCHKVKSYFRFCDKGNDGYYFDGHQLKCLSVRAEEHFVCNTGPNRFATEEDCLRDCVRPHHKGNKCSISRELVPCEENHINVTWWFYDFGL
ncbi:hypothetical protein V5799_006787 [Amblyomma americanum]|uniref:BPTI/Kunitz inhibitor domain-containing protein n=1 Tax=Amblyomma americanum TaxID=6943 RepID=A0AAQ4DVE2_AMBAM